MFYGDRGRFANMHYVYNNYMKIEMQLSQFKKVYMDFRCTSVRVNRKETYG